MDEQSLPLPPTHLYTWVDVELHLADLATAGWPPWLLEARAFWDALELEVATGTSGETAIGWLEAAFGPGSMDRDQTALVLDSGTAKEVGRKRLLPVVLSATQSPPKVRRPPTLADRRVVADLQHSLAPPATPLPRNVQIVAFHSFKGGVGRTVQALALAEALTARGLRVLVADADLEAPGITWMLEAQGRRLDFAFDDFLALLHGSQDGRPTEAVDLGALGLANQLIGGIYVMPATRNSTRIRPTRIAPSDLFTQGRSQYFLTESISELTAALACDVAIVDLRAGISELAAPILLDPRITRVFVTSLSDQSVRGTTKFIREVGRLSPVRRGLDPNAIAIVTQFTESDHDVRLREAAAEIRDALSFARVGAEADPADDVDDTRSVDVDVVAQPLVVPFDSRLLVLPAAWDAVTSAVRAAGVPDRLRRFADDIALLARPSTPPQAADVEPVGLRDRRQRLAEFAGGSVHAETAEAGEFLVTESLGNLVSAHKTEVPIAVVVGAKGSGKTFTFLQMCLREDWTTFAKAARVLGARVDSRLVPVFTSNNLSTHLRQRLEDIKLSAASGTTVVGRLELQDVIKDAVASDSAADSEWRRHWLVTLARSIGVDSQPSTVEADLTKVASEASRIFVIDGLEDMFQSFTTSDREQQALRVLLQDTMEWMRSLRTGSLGLIVFVRRDLVQWAVRQNTRQLVARYADYELRWNAEEALRLALWTCAKAGVIADLVDTDIVSATPEQLTVRLREIWGEKLGTERSREARSDQWFLAALSDFNQQIQARDIVSFLGEAARLSVADSRWSDRLLTPQAMRAALLECSRAKIDAIGDENPRVGELLSKLRDLPSDLKRIPFEPDVVRLTAEELEILEASGVVFREVDQYWIPEIFRHGLGFKAVGRPRILAVANLVRLRNNLN